MKKFVVSFEIHLYNGKKIERIKVEAGSKKLAAIRAISEINKRPEYTNQYKNIIGVEEAA